MSTGRVPKESGDARVPAPFSWGVADPLKTCPS